MTYPVYPMTEKQRAFIAVLLRELRGDAGEAEALLFFATEPTVKDASNKIDALLVEKKTKRSAIMAALAAAATEPEKTAAPMPVARKVEPEVMPEPGYYALVYKDTLRFYRVAEAKGRWHGRVFINRFRSDFMERIDYAERSYVREYLLANREICAKRFAVELTRCYSCGRMLTDPHSRDLGIGPECRKGRGVEAAVQAEVEAGISDLVDLI